MIPRGNSFKSLEINFSVGNIKRSILYKFHLSFDLALTVRGLPLVHYAFVAETAKYAKKSRLNCKNI